MLMLYLFTDNMDPHFTPWASFASSTIDCPGHIYYVAKFHFLIHIPVVQVRHQLWDSTSYQKLYILAFGHTNLFWLLNTQISQYFFLH